MIRCLDYNSNKLDRKLNTKILNTIFSVSHMDRSSAVHVLKQKLKQDNIYVDNGGREIFIYTPTKELLTVLIDLAEKDLELNENMPEHLHEQRKDAKLNNKGYPI